MPKSTMSDDEVKNLLAQIRDWMSKSDEQAAEQVAMKRGGKAKKKIAKKRKKYGMGGYSTGTSSSGTGGIGNRVGSAISSGITRAVGSQAPSQQDSRIGRLNDAMGRMGFTGYRGPAHSGEGGGKSYSGGKGGKGLARAAQVAAPQANLAMKLSDLPAYQNYQQTPPVYSQAPVVPSQAIANFNASQGYGNASPAPMAGLATPPLQTPQASPFYGQPRAQGGRTDSVSSALRMIKNKLL